MIPPNTNDLIEVLFTKPAVNVEDVFFINMEAVTKVPAVDQQVTRQRTEFFVLTMRVTD